MALSEAERDMIASAIARAESVTSAEIVVVVDRIAGAWRSWALVVALLIGMAVPWPLIVWTNWSAATVYIWQIIAAATCALLFLPEQARLKLAPRFMKRRKAHDAALREFTVRGLSHTAGRNGVLIYVALAERYAEVVVDRSVESTVDPKVWRRLIDSLVARTREGRLADGLVEAVEDAGSSLAAQFPRAADDRDELPNKVIVL